MDIVEPEYWGSWKGRVISTIVIDDKPQTWTELLEKTGLAPASLNRVLAELFSSDSITKEGEGPKRSTELFVASTISTRSF